MTKSQKQDAMDLAQRRADENGRAYDVYTYVGFQDVRFYHVIPHYMDAREHEELVETVWPSLVG